MPSKARYQNATVPLHIIQRSDKRKTIFPYRIIQHACIKYGLDKQKPQ